MNPVQMSCRKQIIPFSCVLWEQMKTVLSWTVQNRMKIPDGSSDIIKVTVGKERIVL